MSFLCGSDLVCFLNFFGSSSEFLVLSWHTVLFTRRFRSYRFYFVISKDLGGKEVTEAVTTAILIQPYFILFLKKEGLGQT